jgi:agmatinase
MAAVRKTKRARKAAPKAAPRQRPAPPPPAASLRDFRPMSSAVMPRYAGVPSFLRLPLIDQIGDNPEVDVLLLGVPFDGGTSFRPGARLGPRAVRQASSLARAFSAALGVNIYEELRVGDGGDIATSPHDVEPALESIAARSEAIVRSGVVGGYIGGDQTITLGALRGIHRAKLRKVGLMHIDAHANAAGPAWGRDVHHGSVIRHLVEEGLVDPERSIQIGLRGPYSSADDLAFSLSHGFEIVNVDEVKWDIHSAVSQVRKIVRQGPLYVSVDVCALDPAFAPGTGIPCPGGMNTWELQQILRALVGTEIVGFDVVEISPPYDVSELTALAGVTIVQEILSSLADTRRSARPAPSTKSVGRGRVSA